MRAAYRLQLGPGLGFRAARALVPYLRELGVSHLYLSPSLQARPGSTHGYDVIDPTRISEDLGGEGAFRELCSAGLDVLLDIVPNHMAAGDANPSWPDPKVFDIDPVTGRHRRFFDVDGLAGVRQEDPEVFETTHRKVLELVQEGLVQGLRIDHVDGLADPAGYLERLRERGARHVWIEKILEPGEELRDWPVEGTTGYEFANDVTALFVDCAGEGPLTELYAELTGERRSFAELAAEAKLEQARTTFRPEVEWLSRLSGISADTLETALASLPVYRTYVDGGVDPEDEAVIRAALRDPVARQLLEDPGGEFATRFQQTSGAVMAKGVEDTAFYRYFRLLALNEVGGSPGRFSLPVEEFHAANLERSRRFPLHLLASQTHDTKRSGDVRARLVALSWVPEEWERVVRAVEIPSGVHPNDAYLVLQTIVGAWPLTRERLDGYLEKALREGKLRSSWLEPDEEYERRVQDFAWEQHARLEELARRVDRLGRQIALSQTLLKLACPGVPDIYQGDEGWSFNLVDPDNRRPVDWRRAPDEKQRLVRAVLAERIEGEYETVEAGDDVCAFRRGRHLVAVPLRAGASFDAPSGWRPVVPGLWATSPAGAGPRTGR